MPTCELVTGDRLPRSMPLRCIEIRASFTKLLVMMEVSFTMALSVPVLREARRVRQTNAGRRSSCLTDRTADRGDGWFGAEEPPDCQTLFAINYIVHIA